MNIWAWVYDKKRQLDDRGHHRLASIIDELPTAVCDMRHEQAEAMVPEGLALAGDLEEPWVEIFLRHWLMQSRVLHRYQGRDNLEACVSLLEFAHRPGNRDCPQSMCVVQDFANCYGVTDGPGYAEQRLSVTTEALGRIDPSWPCFECISLEHAGALEDAGRIEEAVEFIDAQLQAATAADVGRSHDKMFKTKAHCLAKLGRGEEALVLLRGAPPTEASGESGKVDYDIAMAEVLCAVGRHDAAARVLPEPDEIDEADGRDWLEIAELLVLAGAFDNDAALGRTGAQTVHRLWANGAVWATAETALMAARLAAARGRRAQADALIELALRAREDLRSPQRLDDDLARTRALVDATPRTRLPPDLVGAQMLAGERLPEDASEALELVGAARARWPDDERLATLEAGLLAHLELVSSACRRLEEFLEKANGAREAAGALGKLLRNSGRHEALEALVRDRFGDDDPMGRWLLATSHERAGRLGLAIDGFEAVLALDPEADPARTRLCEIACVERRWDDALAHANALVERHEPGPHDWDRMVAATALGRWTIVRESATRLGMPVAPGDAPIDEQWGGLWLRTSRRHTLWATRTGPVTARVESISGDRDASERQGDLVLFDPAPVGEEDDEERTIYTYDELVVLEPGGRRAFTIDAVHPGDEALRRLVDALEPIDLRLQRRSGDDYRLTTPHADSVPGVYLYASVPANLGVDEVHRRLGDGVASWPGAAVWLELAELLVEHDPERYADELERQRAVAETHGM